MLCMMHIVVYRDTFETIMENALIDMEEAEENYYNDTLAFDDDANKVALCTLSLFLKIIIKNLTIKPCFLRMT